MRRSAAGELRGRIRGNAWAERAVEEFQEGLSGGGATVERRLVTGVLEQQECAVDADGLERGSEPDALVDRHLLVAFTVNDEAGRVIGRNVGQRTGLLRRFTKLGQRTADEQAGRRRRPVVRGAERRQMRWSRDCADRVDPDGSRFRARLGGGRQAQQGGQMTAGAGPDT